MAIWDWAQVAILCFVAWWMLILMQVEKVQASAIHPLPCQVEQPLPASYCYNINDSFQSNCIFGIQLRQLMAGCDPYF